ncbi:MAG TPA: SusD/RagB family nutrient-binding outer membrane lipoprotein [Chitinophagaceae bacterium]|nr:SusD/RagB family nutrient-binding outer membrane lipoprotein [Chitinophagaceae bacterium]
MKKTFKQIILATIGFAILLSSCTKGFEEMNTDPNRTTSARPDQLLAPALVSTVTYNMMRNRNFNNELMQVTVDMSDAEGKVFRYDYRANWADYLYNGLYSELTNFKGIEKIASDSLTLSNSYKGISIICQSWIYSILTDTYGDLPYSESNRGMPEDGAIKEPAFDRQKDIYAGIFARLEEANTLLGGSNLPAVDPQSDPVYYGNIARWRKFGNSLYLRLLLRVSGKSEVAADAIAKIQEILEVSPSKYPIFANNDESAVLRWTGVAPFVSPYINVREQDFRAPGIASFFIDNLVIWGDPRIDISQGSGGINRWAIAPYMGAFEGMPSGYAPGDNPQKKSYFYSTTSTSTLMREPLAGMMMNYAELKFIMAEASAKGWISSPAETHYNEGALSSIRLWLPNWSVPITTYLAAADITWDDNATLEEKMETIHLQKYYALFLTDMQQWFEYRRTGHPVLPKGNGLRNNGVMPARMTYPVYVQSTNPTNYKAAVAVQGPDVISTEVWWQKP